jgi:hypothetical protein
MVHLLHSLSDELARSAGRPAGVAPAVHSAGTDVTDSKPTIVDAPRCDFVIQSVSLTSQDFKVAAS